MVLGSSGSEAATPSRTRPAPSRSQPRTSATASPRTRTPARSTMATPASPTTPSSPTSNPRLEDLSPENASAVALAAWTRDLKGLWSRAEERFADVCWTNAPPVEAVESAEDAAANAAQDSPRPNYATPPTSPKEDPPEFLWAHQGTQRCLLSIRICHIPRRHPAPARIADPLCLLFPLSRHSHHCFPGPEDIRCPLPGPALRQTDSHTRD